MNRKRLKKNDGKITKESIKERNNFKKSGEIYINAIIVTKALKIRGIYGIESISFPIELLTSNPSRLSLYGLCLPLCDNYF